MLHIGQHLNHHSNTACQTAEHVNIIIIERRNYVRNDFYRTLVPHILGKPHALINADCQDLQNILHYGVAQVPQLTAT